jgi:hypothetical protein
MKNVLYIVSFSLFSLLSCKSNKPKIDYPIGGYNFSVNVDNKFSDYYYYPIKDLEPRNDSVWDGFIYKYYHAFNESNLSIKPAEHPTFRFFYHGFKQMPIIITLTNEYIIVKSGKKYQDILNENEDKLSEAEKWQYSFLTRYYYTDSNNLSPMRKHVLDSALIIYPQLLDPKYFRYLFDKAVDANTQFTYSTVIKSISNKDFEYLVNKINSSGYWGLSSTIFCKELIADGVGFELEANTTKKYNVVKVPQICPNDSSKFIQACQELINYAGMGKEIELFWKSN